MEIHGNTFINKYSNGAHVKVTYHTNPDPKYPYEDRIELELKTQDKKIIGFRMTAVEALTIKQLLTSALIAFAYDSKRPGFDVPLEARP